MVKTRNESFTSESPLAPCDPLGSIPLVDAPGKSTESREAGLDSSTASKPDTHNYLTGVKLFMVILSLTLATFLLLLDSSIVATVCHLDLLSPTLLRLLTSRRQYLISQATSILLTTKGGMEHRIY